MKMNGNRLALVCLSIAVMAAAPVVLAQQQPNSADPYQGVSQPPPDDTIVTTPDTEPPPPAVHAKPSAAVPAPPASTSAAPRSSTPANPDSRYDNTDDGIVTVPVRDNGRKNLDSLDDSNEGAVLHTRENENADTDIVNPAPGSPNELPEGTEIRVQIADALSTNETTNGTLFHGKVMFDVMNGGSVVIPVGSTLRGRVVQVSQGHHFRSAATLRLRPETVILPDGTAYHLNAEVMSSWANGTKTGSEGAIEPSAHVLKKTAEYGVGVGTGALVGGELAGPPGALAGSLVGAGLVTAHLFLQHPEAAVVPAGSEIIFDLTEPLELTPTRN